jgi:ATP-binding cassette subfamily B protein
LNNISFDTKSGQTIAFVWPSGSGKSTILKLLAGLYPATSWTINYNGKSLTTIDTTNLKQRIGLVSQDAQLFTGTIRDNLIFVQPTATDDDCWKVLKQASLDAFVRELPEWLLTMIGEWGIKLSGWQRQRLAIARALIRQPDILIFDEATSALDSIVEKEIADTIHTIADSNPHLITILVAHRLSTVMRSDMIYVLETGSIVESGTHGALVDQKWLYYALWREQSGGK